MVKDWLTEPVTDVARLAVRDRHQFSNRSHPPKIDDVRFVAMNLQLLNRLESFASSHRPADPIHSRMQAMALGDSATPTAA